MRWRASPGAGKAWMEAWERLLWPSNAGAPTPRIGEKNGRKRSLLVDARGVPLSLVASGASVHDVKLLEVTLQGIVYRSEEHTSELQSLRHLVCRLLL